MGACCCRRPRHGSTEVAGDIEKGTPCTRSTFGSTASADSISEYPMFVVRVGDFLGMRSARPHQWLLSQGLAKVLLGETAVFVSHEWCGRSEPDPGFQQLRVLQSVFAHGAVGDLKVERDLDAILLVPSAPVLHPGAFEGCTQWSMWYDYFSVPQPDAEADPDEHDELRRQLNQAVNSLSAYVQACKYFMVLAPVVRHEEGHMLDYVSWRTRGWCRFERLSLFLGSGDLRMLVVRREDAVSEQVGHQYGFEPVGTGDFKYEEDKVRLAFVVERLFRNKLAYCLGSGQMIDYRYLTALRARLFEGLPQPMEGCAGKEEGDFLSRMRLTSWSEEVHRTRPLMLACRAGDTQAIEACVASGADLRFSESTPAPRYFVRRGQTPLHAASLSGQPAAVATLLRLRVDVNITSTNFDKSTPLHAAAVAGNPAVARELLEHGAVLDAFSGWSLTPMQTAVFHSRMACVDYLLEARASTANNPDGLNALHLAAIFNSGAAAVRRLVSAGVDIDARWWLSSRTRGSLLIRLMGFAYALGSRQYMHAVCFHLLGATPLISTVIVGNLAEAEALLSAGADSLVQNARGRDALDLADRFGEATCDGFRQRCSMVIKR